MNRLIYFIFFLVLSIPVGGYVSEFYQPTSFYQIELLYSPHFKSGRTCRWTDKAFCHLSEVYKNHKNFKYLLKAFNEKTILILNRQKFICLSVEKHGLLPCTQFYTDKEDYLLVS